MLMAKKSLAVLSNLGIACLFVLSLWQLGSGFVIFAKAEAAQWLLNDAWQKTLAGQTYVKPWSWADTHPVSRLLVPGLNLDMIILAGSSGRTLAFGPGHVANTPMPGEPGNMVIGGHRDTHFRFLQHLKVGDILVLETAHKQQVHYRVSGHTIVDFEDTSVLNQDHTVLTLITCYPFDAIAAGGPLRYVVQAVPLPS